jgi:hypothetical protein
MEGDNIGQAWMRSELADVHLNTFVLVPRDLPFTESLLRAAGDDQDGFAVARATARDSARITF